MKEENFIYVKLDYKESLNSKKDILSSEANTLNLARTLRRYCLLRKEEFKLKIHLHSRIKEILNNLKKLEINLPKIKIPEVLKEHLPEGTEIEEIEDRIEKAKKKEYNSDIESQLNEIKNRLKILAE